MSAACGRHNHATRARKLAHKRRATGRAVDDGQGTLDGPQPVLQIERSEVGPAQSELCVLAVESAMANEDEPHGLATWRGQFAEDLLQFLAIGLLAELVDANRVAVRAACFGGILPALGPRLE